MKRIDIPISPFSSAPPRAKPDAGPGEGQARDDGMDQTAEETTNVRDIGEDKAPPADVPVPEREGALDDLDPLQIEALLEKKP